MDSFRSIVLIIAVIFLIFCLAIVGIGLMFGGDSNGAGSGGSGSGGSGGGGGGSSSSGSGKQFPPVKSDCPDYWAAHKKGAAVQCHPPVGYGRGTGGCGSLDTSHPSLNGPTGQCNKYKWAQKCGVEWNGVTNTSSPCSDTST